MLLSRVVVSPRHDARGCHRGDNGRTLSCATMVALPNSTTMIRQQTIATVNVLRLMLDHILLERCS